MKKLIAILILISVVYIHAEEKLGKAITLKEKITALYAVLRQHQRVQFSALISDTTDRMNVVLTFLAILELVKQNSVSVEQTEQFSDILIVCQETTNAN